jgi:ABC-2 type transport system ATP-binding protein
MVTFDSISFGYGKQPLFKNLSLSLKAGHVYGLLGKNGEGKTTLLKMMTGLVFAQSGKSQVLGYEPRSRKPSLLSQLFLLPDETHTPNASALQYASINSVFYPLFDQKQFENHLAAFNVPLNQRLEKISFGQRKKVLIAFALATNTPLLLMDEPTNGLDIPSKSVFRKLVAGAMNDDRCIVISTHQVRDLDSLIDEVLVLDNGQITYQQNLNTLAENTEKQPDIEQIFNQLTAH